MAASGRSVRPVESMTTRRPANVPGLLLAAAAAAAFASGALPPALADCPRMCDCKWKSGKESVMCINANLTKIPRQLDASTQLLDLTGNSLGGVSEDAFADAGLLNLQKLFLARCKLRTLDRYAFRKLINLVELDLSQNALAAVPSASLETIPGLRELRLNGNPILTLNADGFKSVPHLVRLDLSSCHVSSVAPRSFAGLENSLEWLKLDGNRLSVVASATIAGLLGLHGLELAGNPWNCSCDLRPLREWMLRRNVPSSTPPTCRAPARLAGRSWGNLELDEFACPPSATPYSKVAATTEGKDVTLQCIIRGVPGPDVRWLWRGSRPIANLSGSTPSNTRRLFLVRTGSSGSNLTIISVEERDAGVYVCSAENRAGRAQANVTLNVQRRPQEEVLTGRLVAATLSVAILLVAASCLVGLCVCRLRKQRRGWALAPSFRSREVHEDNYEKIEMNHKKPDQTVKSNGSVDVSVVRPLRAPYNRKKNGWYRGVALTDEDEGGYEAEVETPTPTLTPTTGTLAASRGSPWTTNSPQSSDAASPPRNWKQRPDSLRCGSAIPVSNTTSRRSSLEQSNDVVAAAVAAGLPQHVLRKQVLSDSGGSLYTSLLSGSEDRSFSDFLVLSPLNQEPPPKPTSVLTDSSIFCTLPRGSRQESRSAGSGGRQGGYHQVHYGSESPLLPDSRYASSGGSSNSSHRAVALGSGPAPAELPSISSGSGLYYPRASSLLSLASPSDVRTSCTGRGRSGPSLPGSPTERSAMETPILNALGKGASPHGAHPTAAGSSGSFDSSSGVYEGRTSQLDKFLDEYQRLHNQVSKMKETCDSIRRADNLSRVPRSILKNKNAFLSPEAPVSYSRYLPPYWLPRDTLMRRISGNDVFES